MSSFYPSESNVQARARQAWATGDGLEAGRLLYEEFQRQDRPRWAGRLLGLACSRMAAPACVAQVLELAFDPERLGAGRDERLFLLLDLAEWVAKVT